MYDVIIIGAGPAGVTAGLYTKRANLNTAIIYKDESSLEKTELIENYYGFEDGVSGKELYEKGIEQAKNLNIDVKNEEVVNIQIVNDGFNVVTDKAEYNAKTLIFATGNKKNTPKIKGIKELEGKGISYCAICDGFFYRNKNIAVLGSGKEITILTNGEKAPEIRADNVKIDTRKIREVRGENKVEEVEFEDNNKLKTEGIFVAQGVAGSSEFAKKLGIITKNDKIIVDENMKTNMKGIYACGDCTGGLLQISKAVYEGTKAGLEVIKYLRENKN